MTHSSPPPPLPALIEDEREIEQYDPDRGLKEIATAEAAEKHWRRAKDRDQLHKAIKAKLLAQAQYVVHRDSVMRPSRETGGPGRGKKGATGPRPVFPNGDPGKDVISRWRTACPLSGKPDIEPTSPNGRV